MNLFFEILVEFGLPVASATVMGIFIYMILKYILESVVGQVSSIHGIIMALDNRIKTMNNDMIKLDLLISHALKLRPDEDRISRADGKTGRKERLNVSNRHIKSIWFCYISSYRYGLVYIFHIQVYHRKS